MARCKKAIKLVITLHTRCSDDADHEDIWHRGKGLARFQFPYQVISWLHGDSREYETERDDDHAWWEEDNPGARSG